MALYDKLRARRAEKRGRASTSTGDVKERDVTDVLRIMERLETNIRDTQARMDLGGLRAKVSAEKAYLQFQSDMSKIQSGNLQAILKSRTTIQKALIDSQSRLASKFSNVYDSLTRKARADARNAGKPGGNAISRAFNAFQETGTVLKGYGGFSQFDPRYIATFEQITKDLNEYATSNNREGAFLYDENGLLIGLDDKGDNGLKARLIRNGVDSTVGLARIMDLAGTYQSGRQLHNDNTTDINRRLETANEAALSAQDKFAVGDESGALADMEEYKSQMHQYHKKWSSANDIGDLEDNEREIALAEKQSHAYQLTLDRYNKLTGSEKEEAIQGRSYAIAEPEFQAWAADYGFDAMGYVPKKEDGTYDYARYVAGGDDGAAIMMYTNQSLRTPGSYGIRGKFTEEIVTVEMKDGTMLTGRRLRRHAADRKGSIRIVTKDGQQLITPDDADRVVVLSRPDPKSTRLDAISRRRYAKDVKQGRYSKALLGAMDAGVLGDEPFAVTDEGHLIDTATGDFVTQSMLDKATSDAYDNSLYTARYGSDGDPPDPNDYLMSPDMKSAWVIENDGGLTPVEPEQVDALRKLPARGLGVKEPDGMRMFGAADIAEGRILIGDNDLVYETLTTDKYGEDEDPAAEKAAFVSARENLKASITPGILGYEVTEKRPGVLTGAPLERETTIGGLAFVDVADKEIPDLEDIEREVERVELEDPIEALTDTDLGTRPAIDIVDAEGVTTKKATTSTGAPAAQPRTPKTDVEREEMSRPPEQAPLSEDPLRAEQFEVLAAQAEELGKRQSEEAAQAGEKATKTVESSTRKGALKNVAAWLREQIDKAKPAPVDQDASDDPTEGLAEADIDPTVFSRLLTDRRKGKGGDSVSDDATVTTSNVPGVKGPHGDAKKKKEEGDDENEEEEEVAANPLNWNQGKKRESASGVSP